MNPTMTERVGERPVVLSGVRRAGNLGRIKRYGEIVSIYEHGKSGPLWVCYKQLAHFDNLFVLRGEDQLLLSSVCMGITVSKEIVHNRAADRRFVSVVLEYVWQRSWWCKGKIWSAPVSENTITSGFVLVIHALETCPRTPRKRATIKFTLVPSPTRIWV